MAQQLRKSNIYDDDNERGVDIMTSLLMMMMVVAVIMKVIKEG